LYSKLDKALGSQALFPNAYQSKEMKDFLKNLSTSSLF